MVDQAWVKDVLERYEQRLVGYARRRLGDLEAAQDVVQECLLRLCRADQAQVAPRLEAWLYTVCRNLVIDHQRKERRMRVIAEPEPVVSPDSTAPLEVAEQRASLRAGIQKLSERDQEVLRLKFEDGLSYKDIAEVMELSVSNVGVILHTAIKRLRSELHPHYTEGSQA